MREKESGIHFLNLALFRAPTTRGHKPIGEGRNCSCFGHNSSLLWPPPP